MIPSSFLSKRRGATVPGVVTAALASLVLFGGAGTVPIKNFAPQGTMQADLNAGGHSITNAAMLSTTNLVVNGTNFTGGTTGPQGPAGTNGTNGAPGATGPAGINGTNGASYTLPVATASTLGGVKQGTNVSIAGDGTISSSAGSANVTGLRKSSGSGSTDVAAVAGTDYLAPNGSGTALTGLHSLAGNTVTGSGGGTIGLLLTPSGRTTHETINFGGTSSGAFTASVGVVDTGAVTGDDMWVSVAWPTFCTPTINFYDSSTTGTLIEGPNVATVAGGYSKFHFVFNGIAWTKFSQGALETRNLGTGVQTALAKASNTAGASVVTDANNLIPYDAHAVNTDNNFFGFDGDSITAGSTGVTSPSTSTFAYLFSQSPFALNHGLFQNAAVGGAVTGDSSFTASGNSLYSRYNSANAGGSSVNLRQYRPVANGGSTTGKAYLFVMAGFNDITGYARTSTQIISDLTNYVTTAKADGFVVILSTILPSTYFADYTGTLPAGEVIRNTVNTAIRNGTIPANYVIDSATILNDPTSAVYFYTDGTHPNNQGDLLLSRAYIAGMTANGFVTRSGEGVIEAPLVANAPATVNNTLTINSGDTGTIQAINYKGSLSYTVPLVLNNASSNSSKVTALFFQKLGTTTFSFVDNSGGDFQFGDSTQTVMDMRPFGSSSSAGLTINTVNNGSGYSLPLIINTQTTSGEVNVIAFERGGVGLFSIGHSSGVYQLTDSVHNIATEAVTFGSGITATETFQGKITAMAGLAAGTVGYGLQVKEGTNAKQGTATLASGTVTVSNTSVTSTSRIQLTGGALNSSTAVGVLDVPTITAGTSFVITSYVPGGTSTQTGDLRTVSYEIFEPAP